MKLTTRLGQLIRQRRQQNWLRLFVVAICVVVVLSTVSILRLPAVTLNDPNAVEPESDAPVLSERHELCFDGTGFTARVYYGDGALLPEDTVLTVEQIEKDTFLFNKYLKKAKEALPQEAEPTEAAFFDIKLLSDGEAIEPEENIDIELTFNNDSGAAPDFDTAVHFGKKETETVGLGITVGQEQTVYSFTQGSLSVTGMLAAPAATRHVWLDGTCGNVMSLAGSDNKYYAVTSGYIDLPSTWKSPVKYDYVLQGWYNINTNQYFAPGARATVSANAVFYADWRAASYDIGQNNEHVVGNLDTSSFITTRVFDYGTLFNTESLSLASSSVSNSSHDETWKLIQTGTTGYGNDNTYDFVFLDWDWSSSGKAITYPQNTDDYNKNRTPVTQGVIARSDNASKKSLVKTLFDPADTQIAKNYIGNDSFLYQYMDKYSDDYDGTHNGYYYYDSARNAASYNQTDGRFYVYDYLERTSDSPKDSSGTVYGNSDFLPFNSPYRYPDGKNIVTYTVSGRDGTNYQYDAKYNTEQSESGRVNANYWYGINSEIKFYLPHAAGEKSGGKALNRSMSGQDLVFSFSGDDDVWVFIDGKLTLDIGGIHGVRTGTIDFSNGKVTENVDDGTAKTTTLSLAKGEHTLQFYYLERGSSQANCSIYFNITPRYALDIAKSDSFTGEGLNGAVFEIYNDEKLTEPASLWDSKAAYEAGQQPKYRFEAIDGMIHCWGFVEGDAYYIIETHPPDNTDYPDIVDDILRLALNESIINTTYIGKQLPGPDGVLVKGFLLEDLYFNEREFAVYFNITNTKMGTSEVSVEKKWSGTADHPDYADVFVMAEGEQVGKTVRLSDDNEWKYTWYGLPKYSEADGSLIEYSVREAAMPGYTYTTAVTTYDTVEDGKTVPVNKFTLTNVPLDTSNITAFSVTKEWADDADHSGDSVVMRLYANGEYTGRQVTLSAANDWTATFDGLALKQNDAVVCYSVKEQDFAGYQPTYGDIIKKYNYTPVTALSSGQTFRFAAGEYALAVNGSGALTAVKTDDDDLSQQWKITSSGGGYTLQNVKSKQYLSFNKSAVLSMAKSGSVFTFKNSALSFTADRKNYTVSVSSGGVAASSKTAALSVSQLLYQNEIYQQTVSNDVRTYVLPNTGGIGTVPYLVGGSILWLIGAAYFLLRHLKNKNKKTGSL